MAEIIGKICDIANMTPERRDKLLSVLHKRQNDLAIVLENVQDPHNISAVLQSPILE